jgi:hypothetical protein
VGFPTLDFESSALNRTQPPFLFAKIDEAQRAAKYEDAVWPLQDACERVQDSRYSLVAI